MRMKFLLATAFLFTSVFSPVFLPAPAAAAADITGVPKIREGDSIQIGTTRIRLGGIDAPSVDQLCLNNSGERWTCGVAARDELIKHVGDKSWTCHLRQAADRRGRVVARCEVDGEDIQKWLVGNGWALSYVRISHDYERRRKGRARGQGRDVAGRVHRAVGLAHPQQEDDHSRRRQATAERASRSCWPRPRDRWRPRPTAPSRATSTHRANASITPRRAAGTPRSR